MIKQSQIELAKYRFHDAMEKLDSARILLEQKKLKDSLSRSYYAMFSAARSLLALKGLDSRKHSGIIPLFNQPFIKTGIIDSSHGRRLKKAQLSRERSDYGDYIVVSFEEVQDQIKDATDFVDTVQQVLKNEIDVIS